MYPTEGTGDVSPANVSRSLQPWLWAMVIAPFLPWYTFPIPIAVPIVIGLATLPNALIAGSSSGAPLAIYGIVPVLGAIWIGTAFIAFASARRGVWPRALWFTLTNLACGVTLLATLLLATGLGPVEPFGYVLPTAFLTLATLPAAYEIASRWLRELRDRAGPAVERTARARLQAIGLGYAFVLGTSIAAIAISAAAAIRALPAPHFYWEEQAIREAAAATFAILGTMSLGAFLALCRIVLTSRAARL